MSSGPPVPIIPQVTSAQEYQFNKERLEKARQLLEVYDSMNEDAFRKHREAELAQKIAEGEKAREELERLKSRNALTITAPPTTNVPQNAVSPNPVYSPPMARIEEIPSHRGFVDQRVHLQNPHPSSSNSQLQVQQWSVPNQTSHPHTFFNNSGTIQEQPDQAAASHSRYYRSKAVPSQAVAPRAIPSQAIHMNRTEYQAALQRQALQSAPLQQIRIPAAQVNIHRPPAPQSQKTKPPQPSQSNAPQKAAIIQKWTVPQKRQTVAPTSAAGSIKSAEHGRKTDSVYSATPLVLERQGLSTEPSAAKVTVTHAAPSASTAGQPKAAVVPMTQTFSSTSNNDLYTKVYKQVSSNQNFLDYLRGWYPHWLTSIRADSYIQITNTPLYVSRRSDNVMFLAVPDGQSGYVLLDLASLVSQRPLTILPAASQDNAQQQTMQPAVPHATTSDAGRSQTSVQASAVPQLQGPTIEPYSTPLQVSSAQTSVRASAMPQSQLSTINEPHSTTWDAGSAQTSVQASAVPHSQLPTSEQSQNEEESSQRESKIRRPADADKRHLARDILRALGIKRRRSFGASGTQALEPAAKRHQPDSGVHVIPARGTEPSQLVFQVVPTDQPPVNKVQSTQEPAISDVGTLPVDDGSVQHVSNVVSSTSAPESAQPNQPVMSVAPPDGPKAASSHPPTNPPIKPSVASGTNDELVTVPSTLIDDLSPLLQLGPVIENVAADSAEPTFMEIHGSATPLSPTHPLPYIVDSPVAKTLDIRNKSEDAASEFDRLTIQDEAISLAPANHRETSLQIEELEELEEGKAVMREESLEGEIVMLQDVREPSLEEGEVSMHQNELEASQEEGEISMQQDELEASQEEGEIAMRQDELEASQEEGEISMQLDVLEVSQMEGTVLISPDAGGVPSIRSATPIQGKEEKEQASRTPLFLPSPSASPQRVESPSFSRTSHPPIADYADEDVPGVDVIPEATEMIKRKSKSFYRRTKRKDQPFYILVPPPPPYLIKLRKEEARRRRKRLVRHRRSPSREDDPDPATSKALEDSTTRLVERRCKWNGCDTVMNSPQHLFEHLRQHCVPDLTKKYVLCYWTGCGDHIPNEQIDEHLATHAFTPLLCPYEDCEESFRAVQSLMKHHDLNHNSGRLKRTPEPFAPNVKEPPPLPGKVPAYVIKSGPVRQEPIDDQRHLNTLGPWVYNNIAGPVRVTKKYNAAKGKPDDYEFLRDSHFSTNPSQPAKIRDMSDLKSVEVSGLVSDGLVIWPPPKKKFPAKKAETGLKLFMPNSGSEEDELQDDDLSGNNDIAMEQAPNYEVKHVSNLSRHQTSSEEDAVLSMLTEQ